MNRFNFDFELNKTKKKSILCVKEFAHIKQMIGLRDIEGFIDIFS